MGASRYPQSDEQQRHHHNAETEAGDMIAVATSVGAVAVTVADYSYEAISIIPLVSTGVSLE